ncbi:MAG: carbohydrate-binding protein [Sphingobacteriales bacterium]|nr:MAG: carbohydrate-binding protein [Sphingobacteriales bacterium]
MKTRNLLFRAFTALLLLCSVVSNAQVQTARYVSMNPSTNGYYEYLPQGYNASGSETYPLILFVHGLGETGAGNSSTLPAILRNAIPRLINEGKFPTSFTVNGKTSKFIVISPQFNAWPKFTDIDAVLDYIEAHYKIDRTRIYVTGLSMGGGVTWEYGGCSSNLKYVQRIAAMVPICGASSPSAYRARTIAKYNLPVWALHNQNDPTVSVENTNQYIDLINQAPAPVPAARKTIFNASGHDAWTKAYDPNYRENGMNVYEWMLQYSRPAQGTNPPPVVNAGADKTITLPTNSVALAGSATDANGSVSSYAWTRISGPTQFTFSNAAVANPTVSNLAAGTYVFRLTATDNQSASAYDEVTITVNAAANAAPVANAGADKSITLPTNSVALTGSGTDANGTIASYRWTKTSGPTQFTFSNAAVASPTVSNLVAGTYTFRLTVTDNQGATGTDDVQVVVNSAANTAPVANAGTDKAITLPTNSVALTGSGTDANGSISSYAWTKTAGPSQFAFSNAAVASPTVSNLVAGTYTFRLTVTDNGGLTAYDDVNVVVSAAPVVTYYTIPGKIEAEQYFQMNGVQTEATTDAGAGLNVGWIEPGDWMDYNVNVTAAASYTVNFRVAAPAANSQLQLRKADGSILTTVTIPATGDYQAWTTVSATVALTAGNQVLRVYAATAGWNFNWFEFAQGTTTPGGAKYIRVNVFAGTNPYNNAEWNNWNFTSQSPALKYADGSTSTAKASLSVPGNMADNGTAYLSGMAPAGVLRHSSYATVQRILTISGLSPSKTYDIELYASRSNNPGNNTIFTLGGINQTVSSYNNSTQKAIFTGRTPDANGNLVVAINRTGTYNYLNGFTITENNGAALMTSRGAAPQVSTENETVVNGREKFGVYPNPFVDQVFIQLNNTETGLMNVSVIDQSGRVVRQQQFNKAQALFNETINLQSLQPGLYLIKVQIGTWSETKKVMRN